MDDRPLYLRCEHRVNESAGVRIRLSGVLPALLLPLLLQFGPQGVPAFPQPAPPTARQQPSALPVSLPLDLRLRFTLIPIDGSLKDDPALRALIEPFRVEVTKKIKEVIGSSDREMQKGFAGGLLGQLVTDAIRMEASRVLNKQIDLALQNSGGMRNPIAEGPITIEAIYRLMPFENEIYVLEMTGVQVRTLLEFIATRMANQGGDAQSGARMEVGEGKLLSAELRGRPLVAKATYLVAVSDYMYGGGSGYQMLAEVKDYKRLNLTIRDAVINYIRHETDAGRKIKPRLDDRVKRVNGHL